MSIEQEVFTAGNGESPISVNDQHLACVLLLDTSSSMHNDGAIDKVNEAIKLFKEQCVANDALKRGLDVAVVEFNSEVKVIQEFAPVENMITPVLEANGQTHMGAGLTTAMNLLEERKTQYKEIGIPYHRPWIFMISDGAPNDEYAEAFEEIKRRQELKKLELWAVGVPGYDKTILTSLTKRVIELDKNLKFSELFEWLSTSLSAKANSAPGDAVKYENLPQGSSVVPSDWGV